MSNRQQVRKRGFSFLSFFLGFLFGMIFLVGAIAGVGYFALTAPLDTVFKTAGIQNKDEDGNYLIVNTDPENGGVNNALQLFAAVSSLVGGESSVAEVEGIVPALSGYVDQILDMAAEYVEIDRAAFRRQPFGQMVEFITDTVQDIQPAVLLEKLGMGGITEDGLVGEIISAILYGTEADYVEVNGESLPVYVETVDGESRYMYKSGNRYYGVNKTDEGYAATDNLCTSVDENAVKLSGNFYFVGEEKIVENPVTLRTLTSGNAFSGLEGIMLTDLIKGEEGGIVDSILGGISLGEVLSGELNFDEKINTLEIATLLGNIPVTNNLVAYLAYGITEITETNGVYTANVNKDGEQIAVTLTVEGGNIKGIKDANDDKVTGTTVNQITPRIDGVLNELKIKEIIGEGDNKIMQTLGEYTINQIGGEIENIPFGDFLEIDENSPKIMQLLAELCISDLNGGEFLNDWYVSDLIEPGDNKVLQQLGNMTIGQLQNGEFAEEMNGWRLDLFIEAGDNELLQKLGGLTIGELQDGSFVEKMNGWQLKTVFDCTGNEVLEKLGEMTIGELQSGDFMDNVTLADLLDVNMSVNSETGLPDTATNVLAYFVYGITDLKPDAYSANTFTAKLEVDGVDKDVVITVTEGKISSVTMKEGGAEVAGTPLSGVSEKMNGLLNKLTVGQITGETEGVLGALKDSTVNSIASDINNLTVGDIYPDLTEEDGVLYYLTGASISNLPSEVMKLELGMVISINQNDPQTSPLLKNLAGTPINELSSAVSTLTLEKVIDIPADNKLLNALAVCTIAGSGEGSLSAKIETLTLGDVMDVPADNKLLNALAGCTITGSGEGSLSAKIETLTLGDVMDIPADNKLLNTLKDCTLMGSGENSISSKVNGLKLGDVMSVPQDNALLKSLENCSIMGDGEGSLSYKLDNLTVAEAIGGDNTGILAKLSDKKIKDLGSEINNLTINDICENDIYVDPAGDKSDPANVSGIWKVLLVAKNETTGASEVKTYKISEMGQMVENISGNIKTMTLRELVSAGVLDDPGNLDKTVTSPSTGASKKFGEMTITEILSYIAEIPE